MQMGETEIVTDEKRERERETRIGRKNWDKRLSGVRDRMKAQFSIGCWSENTTPGNCDCGLAANQSESGANFSNQRGDESSRNTGHAERQRNRANSSCHIPVEPTHRHAPL